MDKPANYKSKNKKQSTTKTKTTKKRTSKNDGPTCSMFFADITRRLAARKRQEVEAPRNIVQSIVDSITTALPIKISRKTPPKSASPMKIETLQTFSPELLPNDTISIPHPVPKESEDVFIQAEVVTATDKCGFKMPRMPIVSSEVMKAAAEKRKKSRLSDAETTMSADHDMATEIAKHVDTLRKISLIAEEFNQKTAKNLKEIVDSVQEDLIKKLEEIQAEQKAKAIAQAQALQLQQAEQAASNTE